MVEDVVNVAVSDAEKDEDVLDEADLDTDSVGVLDDEGEWDAVVVSVKDALLLSELVSEMLTDCDRIADGEAVALSSGVFV